MENVPQTPPKSPVILQAENKPISDLKYTPVPAKSHSPICNSGKNGTPERLKVPKALKNPERYTSPTDHIHLLSPATRGILARRKKLGSKVLPPSAYYNHPPKITGALKLEEFGSFQLIEEY